MHPYNNRPGDPQLPQWQELGDSEAPNLNPLIEQLKKPVGVSDEELSKRAADIIERAIENGLTEVQVFRFPSDLCTDRGRAINQQERGWDAAYKVLSRRIPMRVRQPPRTCPRQPHSQQRGKLGPLDRC